MRRTFGIPVGTQVLSLLRADADLKAHPRYRLAKQGDERAALDLVIDLAVPWLFANEHRFSNVSCCPVSLWPRTPKRPAATMPFRKPWPLFARQCSRAASIRASCRRIAYFTRGPMPWSAWQPAQVLRVRWFPGRAMCWWTM